MLTLRLQLLTLAETYSMAVGAEILPNGKVSLGNLSRKIFNDGKTLERVRNDGDVTTGSFEAACEWFDQNWPKGTPWPDCTRRPSFARRQEELKARRKKAA